MLKKLFILIMILGVTTVFINKDKMVEVEASRVDVDIEIECDNPRFMYNADINGGLQNISCTIYRYDTGKRFVDVQNDELSLIQVDRNGNFIKLLDNFETDYVRANSSLSAVSKSEVVTSGNDDPFIMCFSGVWFISPDTECEDVDVYSLDLLDRQIGGFGGTTEVLIGDPSLSPVLGDFSETIEDGYSQWIIIGGSYVDVGDFVTLNYTYYPYDDVMYDYEYDLSGITFEYNDSIIRDDMFYQILYGDNILYSGMIAKSPTVTVTSDTGFYTVEVGDHYLVEDDIDYNDMSRYTFYNDGRYILLNYELPTSLTATLYFRFYDIATGTVQGTITSDDILDYQGCTNDDCYTSFIPINIRGGEINALSTDTYSLNDDIPTNIENLSLDEGVYIMLVEDVGGTVLDVSTYLTIITDDSFLPLSLDLRLDEMKLSEIQRVDFKIWNEFIYESFSTTFAKDISVGDDFSDIINNLGGTVQIGYEPHQLLDIGDSVLVKWVVSPTSMPKSLDPTEFEITFEHRYTINDVSEFSSLNSVLTLASFWGFDNSLSLSILGIFIILIINVGLALLLKVKGYILYAIINALVILVFNFMGLLDEWFTLGLGVIIFLSLIYTANVSRSDEL